MAQVHKLPPQCHLPRAAPCPAQRPGRQGLGPSAGHPTGTANLAGVDARLKGAMGIRGYQWISIGDINFGSFGLKEDLVAIRIAIRPPPKIDELSDVPVIFKDGSLPKSGSFGV